MQITVDYVALGKRIRRRRRALALTQDQMSKKAGISLPFYGHIERGTRKASIETLLRIGAALSTTVSDLLDDFSNAPNDAPHDSSKDILKELFTQLRTIIDQLEEYVG